MVSTCLSARLALRAGVRGPTDGCFFLQFVDNGVDPRYLQSGNIPSFAFGFIGGDGDRLTKQFGSEGLTCHPFSLSENPFTQ